MTAQVLTHATMIMINSYMYMYMYMYKYTVEPLYNEHHWAQQACPC